MVYQRQFGRGPSSEISNLSVCCGRLSSSVSGLMFHITKSNGSTDFDPRSSVPPEALLGMAFIRRRTKIRKVVLQGVHWPTATELL